MRSLALETKEKKVLEDLFFIKYVDAGKTDDPGLKMIHLISISIIEVKFSCCTSTLPPGGICNILDSAGRTLPWAL